MMLCVLVRKMPNIASSTLSSDAAFSVAPFVTFPYLSLNITICSYLLDNDAEIIVNVSNSMFDPIRDNTNLDKFHQVVDMTIEHIVQSIHKNISSISIFVKGKYVRSVDSELNDTMINKEDLFIIGPQDRVEHSEEDCYYCKNKQLGLYIV